jgi:hypothetical protein
MQLNTRRMGVLVGLLVFLVSCTASVNGSSVTPIQGAECKNADVQNESCTIGFGADDGALTLSTDTVNMKLSDTSDGSVVGVNLRNNATNALYSIAVIAGPESCTTGLRYVAAEGGEGYVAVSDAEGCAIVYTDVVAAQRIKQVTLNFTIAQTAYIVVSDGTEGGTQAVITVIAAEG